MNKVSAPRLVSGILAGVAVAMLTIMLVETVNGAIYPSPAIDFTDPAAVSAMIAAMPMSAKLTVVAGWLFGALFGAALAVAVTRQRWAGWVPAGAVLVGGLFNALAIDHPVWMDVAAAVAPLIGGALGIALARRFPART